MDNEIMLFLGLIKESNLLEICKDKSTPEIIELLSKIVNENCKNKVKIVNNKEMVHITMDFTLQEADYFFREFIKNFNNGNIT